LFARVGRIVPPTMSAAPVIIEVPEKLLIRWNAAMAIFHSIFAVVTLAVANVGLEAPVFLLETYPAEFGNTGDGWQLKARVSSEPGHMYLTWTVFCFFLICALFHTGNATIWRSMYLRLLAQCYCPSRWIEYSMSASVMTLIIAYVTGSMVQQVLFMLFTLTLVTMFFGHLHEVICRPASPDAWAEPSILWRLQAHFLGYIPQIAAWGILIAQFMQVASRTFRDRNGKEITMPAYVYAIVFGEVLLFWSFGLVQLVVSLRKPADYVKGEIAYQSLSLGSKGLLGLVLLANVLAIDKRT